jgi:hypothetical protein
LLTTYHDSGVRNVCIERGKKGRWSEEGVRGRTNKATWKASMRGEDWYHEKVKGMKEAILPEKLMSMRRPSVGETGMLSLNQHLEGGSIRTAVVRALRHS